MSGHRAYIPALDGLRGLAVLAVVVSHCWPQALPGGWAGVDIFFVLSGFLITSILLAEHERTGRISFRNFYTRRALRLLPAMGATLLMGVLIAGLLYSGSLNDTLREAIAAFLSVANWLVALGQVRSGLLVHTWTLSIEEQFYWTWPIVLSVALAVGGRRAALWTTIVLIGVVLLHRLTGLQGAYFRTDARADSLLVGCAVAIAASLGILDRVSTRIIKIGGITGTLSLGIVLAAGDHASSLMEGVGFTLVGLAAATVVVAIAVRPMRLPVEMACCPPLVWVGQRSYGVYLYHPLCIAILAPRLGTEGLFTLVGTALLVLVTAAASYRYLETPFLRLKDGVGAPGHRQLPTPVPLT
ncbi:MAG: acyltransferase [Candidatus Dormibacteraeota bacterium]|uniref:Acyltransferase n=1 Tax=Candidatus Amunia macphersoniae TaxID=3127014 RepID=A0A934KMP2_9BACT|nr:acyltransferase [Candidatus Dormibacteraeota bacterium]